MLATEYADLKKRYGRMKVEFGLLCEEHDALTKAMDRVLAAEEELNHACTRYVAIRDYYDYARSQAQAKAPQGTAD